MSDKGILFSAPMVRALIDGRKTQTRRLIKPQPPEIVTSAGVYSNTIEGVTDQWTWLSGDPTDCDSWGCEGEFRTGFKPGDRLWVREEHHRWTGSASGKTIIYTADGEWIDWGSGWRGKPGGQVLSPPTSGRHMAKWASRLTLLVADVRVQRVQEIGEGDALAEGIYGHDTDLGPLFSFERAGDAAGPKSRVARPAGFERPGHAYMALWDRLHTKSGHRWHDNPWVIAITFRVINGNIDSLAPP